MAGMAARILTAAAAVGMAAAQLRPPAFVSAVAGDSSATVSWRPQDNGAATQYEIFAELQHPYPEQLRTEWTFVDSFDTNGFNTVTWDFTSGLCRYYSGYACWTTAPGVVQSSGSMNMTIPAYSYQPYSWGTGADNINRYGRNGVAYAVPKNIPTSIFTNTTHQFMWTATLRDITTTSSTTYMYANAGFVMYDFDSNNVPHWLMRYYLVWYSNTNYAYLYYEYAYHYSWSPQNGYRNQYWAASIPPSNLPMTMQMLHDGTSTNLYARLFKFGYSWPADVTGAAFGDTGYNLYDYYLYYWSGYANPNYANLRLGLFGESTYIYNLVIYWDFFGVYPTSTADLQYRGDWFKYWSGRNASIAAFGSCAVSRSVRRVVPSDMTTVTLRGLDMGSGYRVSVAASDGTTTTAFNNSVTGTVFPALVLPASLPTPLMYLDANALPSSASAGINTWKDVTGQWTFVKSSGSTGPFLRPKSAKVPYASVEFRNAASDMELPGTDTNPTWQFDSTYTNHAMSIFMIYKPTNAAYYGQNSAVLARGGYFGYAEPGFTVNAVNYYYTWTCTSSCNYIYGFQYGAYVKNGDYEGAGVYGFYADGPYGTAGAHPHSTAPTLLTYNYRKISTTGTYGTYRMDACQGVITGSGDQCTASAQSGTNNLGAVNGGTQQWVPGQKINYNIWLSSNEATYWNTYGVNDKQVTRLGAQGWTYSWWSYTYYYVQDRMTGDLQALMMYKGGSGLSNSQIVAAQSYLADRYFLRCPAVPASPNSNGGCTMGNIGSVCTLSCASGYSRAGGSTNMRCSAGFFVGKNIFCAKTCPVVASPPDYATCSKYFVYDEFTPNATFGDLVMYDTAPALPTLSAAEYWAVDSTGTLVGNAPTLDDACATASPSGLFVNQPAWLAGVRLTDPLTTSVDIFLDNRAQGGLMFRVLSNQTYYRVTFIAGGYSFMEKFIGGAPARHRFVNISAVVTQPRTWYRITAYAKLRSQTDLTNDIIITINGTVVWNVTDSDIPAGSSGVHVTAGRVRYDNFGVFGTCDSNGDSCQNLNTGMECQYTCRQGFGLRGDFRQRCGSAGAITSAAPECVPLPPTISAQSFNISEAAPINTVSGTILATAAGPGQVIIFELLSVNNNETLKDRFGNVKATATDVFRVGTCSGELTLNVAGILDYYYGTRVFNLRVRACANGRNDSCTEAPIFVTVLRAPRAPVWEADPVSGSLTEWTRSVPENSAVGAIISPAMLAFTPEPNPILYNIAFGNSDGVFAINNRTGFLSVARAVLNYEVQDTYTLLITARDSVYTNLTNSIVVKISVTDVNDVPMIAATQEIQVIENSFATAGERVGMVMARDEDAGDRLEYAFTSGSNPNVTLNINNGMLMVASTRVYNPELDEVVIVNGLQTRETLRFRVTVTDMRGASVISNIVVYIIANITASGQPVLDSVELPAGGLRTTGGETIVLRGQNLDTIPKVALDPRLLFVFYSAQVGDPWQRNYTGINCTVQSADTAVCVSPPGYGSGLAITARWGTLRRQVLTSTVLLVTYRVPTVSAICGNCYTAGGDARNVPTAGGLVLRLTGTNFGPEALQTPGSQREPWPIEVRYGHSFEYRAFPFYVAGGGYTGHSVVFFKAVEGVGSDLPMRVIVGGLSSVPNNSTAAITYGKPRVFSMDPPAGATYTASNFSTGGGQDFTIVGENFGPDSYAVVVQYSANRTVLANNVSTTLLFSYAAACRKPNGIAAHTTLECKTAPGVGAGLLLTVAAAGQMSPRDPGISVSYAPPAIQFIKGAGARLADTAGGQQVTLQGDNLGPVALGDGTPGAITTTPLTAMYGKTASEYVAAECRVSSDIPNVVSCLTAPGTGTNHTWQIVVGGQDSGVFTRTTTGYAPPVVSTFTRSYADIMAGKDTRAYSTLGSETVVITGKNFGPAIEPEKFTALYRTQLRDPLTDAPLWDGPNTTDRLGDDRGMLTYIPSTGCVMTVAHKQLSCTTERGAGADLQWVITVDEQASTFPATGYERPRIRQIVDFANGVSPVTAASTDGGVVMLLKGDNFGPRLNCRPGAADPCLGYVQSVRYGLNGVEQLMRDFTVIDHQTIKVTLGPGYGQNLRVTVTVADQESDASDDVFSYGVPTILSVSPTSADTDPTAEAPTTITIVGRDFSLLDPLAQVGVVFGNVEDGTQSPLLGVQTMVPTWTDPVGAAAHTPGSAHTVTFLLPQGLSASRAIRVRVYERGKPTGYSVTSTPSLGSSSFSYTAPSIMAVIVQTPDAIRANGTTVMDFVRANFDLVATPQVFALTILGKNFGPPVTQTSDRVARTVEGRPLGAASPWALWGSVFSWSHEKLIIFTAESSGSVRVNNVGKSFATGLDVPHVSNEFEYTDLSPSVGNLVGSTGPFDTRGGATIAFTLKHLSSLIANLSVTVGGRDCPILTAEGEVVAMGDVRTRLVLNSSYYVTPNGAPGTITADTTWTITCRVPEGEGTSNALVVRRDADASNADVLIAYIPPSIATYAVEQEDGTWVTLPYTFGTSSITVPNDGARIRLTGLNFGLCPTVYMAEGPLVRLGGAGCASVDAGTVASHTALEFTAVRGDGRGFRLVVDVAGQDTSAQFPITFAYFPPTVTYFTPEGRTAGGDVIVGVGKNLGVYRIPIVTIGGVACGDVTSFNTTYFTCVLAEGSGGAKNVVVDVNTQVWIATAGFSYSLPVIQTLVVDGAEAFTEEARGRTPGGYLVELHGDNFGLADYTRHCLFVAWRNRDRVSPLTCNARADFLGEGEVPLLAIRTWNHTYVKFVMPPGLGGFEVVPFVAAQSPATPFVFRYTRPNITAELSPNHGGTNGGTRITITGINFGAKPKDTTTLAQQAALFPASLPATLDEYLTEARPPTAFVAVNFFRSCITSARDARGFIPAPVASCYHGSLLSHAHNSIEFLSAGGIGVNRSVSVTVFDEEPDPVNPSQKRVWSETSNDVKFNYDPPRVRTSADNPVLQLGSGQTNIVTLSGDNFGSLELQVAQGWTTDEKRVEVVVGNVPALAAARITRYGQDTLQVTIPDMTVGRKNITYTVAGQTGFTPAMSFAAAIFTACLGGRKDFRTTNPGPWFGTFARDGELCAPCPLGAVCAGFDPEIVVAGTQSEVDRGTHTYPRPVIGWYNLNSTDLKTSGMYAACPEQIASAYPGRDVCIVKCEPAEACLGDNVCSFGYRSVEPYFRCATCDVGFYKRANECVRCPDSPWALVIGFTMLVAFGGGLAYVLNKKKINLAFVSIGIDYFQVIAIFAQSKVQWPPALKELFHILSAFNLNIEIVAPECIVPDLAFKQKWSFIMALPLAIVAFFALLSGVAAFYKSFIKGQKVKLASQGAALASSVLLLMYIMYIYLTRNVLDIFNCTPTDPPDGKTYMTAVFEECGKPGGSQVTLMPAAIIAALVYVAGYPSALGWLLYKNRESVMEDQLLRAKGVGNDRLTNPHCYQLRKRWSRTYYQFKPDYYFWTLVIIVRKFCIAATYILFNKNPSFQLAAAMLIMFLAYTAQVTTYPYMGPADCDGVLKDHEKKSFSSPIHARLRATIAGIDSRGRKSVRRNLMNAEGKIDAAALLGVLRSWLFNYNTVEEILLFSAVIVALMGIMYASNTSTDPVLNAYYKDARDAVTAVVMAVIIATIVYFVIVVVTEISILSAEANRRRVAAKAALASKGDPSSPSKAARKSPRADDFQVGDVKAATNPMFLQAEKSKSDADAASGELSAADAIRAMREPPPNELWYVYQRTYADLIARVNEMKGQLGSYPPEVRRMAEAALRGEAVVAADFVDEEEVLLAAAAAAKAAAVARSPKSPGSSEDKKLLGSASKRAAFKPKGTGGDGDGGAS